ncbi:MAG: OadG family protein [Desulfofustis sp. PB-SRB1]|jgi:sodium pump decarboxylase gamma subunit|nr:OadG family protein [Desulfofustis sp. PB-SRB1]MBM1001534.1 OadG family protein [Desulfofustis sp. PB-SRB1]HBH29065.1 hypothetical protein [Desulfofustis sp.]HBH30632.1 hypothetical protein [Desulfofustis sp.]
MEFTELLKIFSDPATIDSLSLSQRISAGLFTTMLGMGITFCALILLHLLITAMGLIEARLSSPAVANTEEPEQKPAPATDETELVAAITAALAVMLDRPPHTFIVKNITPYQDASPVWYRAGMIEQIHNRL